QGREMRGPAERHDLDRQRRLLAEALNQLAVVHDDDELPGGGRHDLLPQQRAAQAFDQVEPGIDLVGAIHREIQPRPLLERDERDAERRRALGGVPRRRHAGDILQCAIAQPLAEQFEEMPDGRAGAEAEHHAVLDPIQRPLGRSPLEGFTIAHDDAGLTRPHARRAFRRAPMVTRRMDGYLAPFRRRSSTRRTATAMWSAVRPYLRRSASGAPLSAYVSSSPTNSIGTGCSRATAWATRAPRPPCTRCYSAVTMAPVSTAARRTASSSSGLTVAMSSTRTWMPSCARRSWATIAAATMSPLAMMVASRPSRSCVARPNSKSAGSASYTSGTLGRPSRR